MLILGVLYPGNITQKYQVGCRLSPVHTLRQLYSSVQLEDQVSDTMTYYSIQPHFAGLYF